MDIAERYFGTASDQDQIPITMESLDKLVSIDEDAILIKTDEHGEPISWVVVIPTGKETMELFLDNAITEKELFDRAVAENKREALYLCAAFTVPEYRGKGYAQELFSRAVKKFAPTRETDLFAWIYSPEGQGLFEAGKKFGREIRTKTKE